MFHSSNFEKPYLSFVFSVIRLGYSFCDGKLKYLYTSQWMDTWQSYLNCHRSQFVYFYFMHLHLWFSIPAKLAQVHSSSAPLSLIWSDLWGPIVIMVIITTSEINRIQAFRQIIIFQKTIRFIPMLVNLFLCFKDPYQIPWFAFHHSPKSICVSQWQVHRFQNKMKPFAMSHWKRFMQRYSVCRPECKHFDWLTTASGIPSRTITSIDYSPNRKISLDFSWTCCLFAKSCRDRYLWPIAREKFWLVRRKSVGKSLRNGTAHLATSPNRGPNCARPMQTETQRVGEIQYRTTWMLKVNIWLK